jgi:hypothetical protein
MIPVRMQPEPTDFQSQVAEPGREFLSSNPRPKILKDYWSRATEELYRAYQGICAYSATWIAYDTSNPTVDHFLPKIRHPEKAYSWENLRLCCPLMNSRKRDYADVLDPFVIQTGWFILDFPSLLIKPGKDLSDIDEERVVKTIFRLKLNGSRCRNARLARLQFYIAGKIPFASMKETVPFMAQELERQNLVEKIKEMMPSILPSPN